MLRKGESDFLLRVCDNDEVSSVSHLLKALANGVDLPHHDLLLIEDCLIDQSNSIVNSSMDVPDYFEHITDIVVRLINTSGGSELPVHQKPNNTPHLNTQVTHTRPAVVAPDVQPVLTRSVKSVRKSSSGGRRKRVQYIDFDLTPDNVPQYLRDIHEIICSVVKSRCIDEINLRVALESKLNQMRAIVGAVDGSSQDSSSV